MTCANVSVSTPIPKRTPDRIKSSHPGCLPNAPKVSLGAAAFSLQALSPLLSLWNKSFITAVFGLVLGYLGQSSFVGSGRVSLAPRMIAPGGTDSVLGLIRICHVRSSSRFADSERLINPTNPQPATSSPGVSWGSLSNFRKEILSPASAGPVPRDNRDSRREEGHT